MPYKLISPAAYQDFVQALVRTQEAVAGPVWKEEKTVFALLEPDSPQVGASAYIPTLLPPKKYLFPSQETLFTFAQGQVKEAGGSQPLILLGVRPCDLNAFRQMDKFFLEDIADPYYKAKRQRTLLLGWDCVQHCDEWCFCESVGGLAVKDGYDLFFSPLQNDADDCLVSIGSKAGADLLARHAQAREASEELIDLYQRQQADKLGNFPKRFREGMGCLPLLLIGSYQSPLWKELGDLCLGCGACNIVCPTCSCFDVQDEMNLDMQSGRRYRCWDGCMLQDFALVAGGHNFRPERSQRIRHRMYRKFKYQMQRYDEPFCVGCGRCARSCLVDINPFEIINRLFELNLERRQSGTD